LPKRLSLLVAFAALAAVAVTPAAGQAAQPAAVAVPVAGRGGESVAPAEAYAFEGSHVRRTQADTWHFSGDRGAGVTVGILGMEFGGPAWDRAARVHEVPPRSQVASFCVDGGNENCDHFTGDFNGFAGDREGVALAEIVHDMAPAASLAVATITTVNDLEAAMDWFASEGVDVVVRTSLSVYDGPGDGTGRISEIYDAAVANDIIVVQALGDAGDGGYYRWPYADLDDDGWIDFDDQGDETLTVTDCGWFRGLRWDDFGEGAEATDYNISFFQTGATTARVTTRGDQQAGVPPIEFNEPCHFFGRPMEARVRMVDPGAGAEGDMLEVLGESMSFEHSTTDGSAGGAGEDSINPGVITVGALDSATSAHVAPYSSRGPTLDNRTNPDLTAASCLATFSLSTCLTGTAASAAVVGGAIALYRSENPAATPGDVATWLTTEAVVDRGPIGPDNDYGAGELTLPSMGPRPRFRPDARIRGTIREGLIGDNVYTPAGARQNATQTAVRGREVRFTVSYQNDGNARERFIFAGSDNAYGFEIAYLIGNSIQPGLHRGEYSTIVLPPGATRTLTVKVTLPDRPTVAGIRGTLRVYSQTTLRQVDAVTFTTLVR